MPYGATTTDQKGHAVSDHHSTPLEAAFLPPLHITITGPVTVHIHQPADPAAITGPILAALAATKGQLMTDFHGELGTALDQIISAIDEVDTDLSRELADFATSVAPKLSDDERAKLASIAQRLLDADSSINAADPAVTTPAPEPTAGDGTGAGDPTDSGAGTDATA